MKAPVAASRMTITPAIEEVRRLRAIDRELSRKRESLTRAYAYGNGATFADLTKIHNKQTENWINLLNLYGMTKDQWRKTSLPERNRLWGDF